MSVVRFMGKAAAAFLIVVFFVGGVVITFYPTYTEEEARPRLEYYAHRAVCLEYQGRHESAALAVELYNNIVRRTRQEGKKLYLDPDALLSSYATQAIRESGACDKRKE